MSDDPERSAIHRELDPEEDDPGPHLAATVADIEGREMTEMSTMYECIDGVLDHLFSTPPSEEAQMEVEFSYEGYRISVDQSGWAEFVRTE